MSTVKTNVISLSSSGYVQLKLGERDIHFISFFSFLRDTGKNFNGYVLIKEKVTNTQNYKLTRRQPTRRNLSTDNEGSPYKGEANLLLGERILNNDASNKEVVTPLDTATVGQPKDLGTRFFNQEKQRRLGTSR